MNSSVTKEFKGFTLNHFILQEQIGVGKFGLVYKAIQKQSQKEVAIKIIIKKTVNTPELHKQLQRQIETQSHLKHPFICQLYAYFQDANSLYIVLEYCANGSLSIPIRNARQSFSYKKIASILQQLLQALAYMHQRHVMHRDIKLENVLLDKNFNAKISDFGWCVHSQGERKTFCGTMEYINPEMLNKLRYSHNIDMYCLGIILYEMFYFKSPFFAETENETFQKIKKGVIPFPDEVRVIPEAAKTLIRTLLERDPEKRPSARQLFNHDFIKSYLYENGEQLPNKERLTQQEFAKFQDQLKKSQVNAQSEQSEGKNEDIFKTPKQE